MTTEIITPKASFYTNTNFTKAEGLANDSENEVAIERIPDGATGAPIYT